MQTSGIKVDLKSKRLLFDESEKIEKVIKFAVKQAVSKIEKKPKTLKKSSK